MNYAHALPLPHAALVGLLLVAVALFATFALIWIAVAIDWTRVTSSRARRRVTTQQLDVESVDVVEVVEVAS